MHNWEKYCIQNACSDEKFMSTAEGDKVLVYMWEHVKHIYAGHVILHMMAKEWMNTVITNPK
jgi:hypothetical protein